MKRSLMTMLLVVGTWGAGIGWAAGKGLGGMEEDFVEPPEGTKPRCYWYWMDGKISREGITKDLEAMKRVGIGEGYIGIINGGGKVKALSEEWWGFLEHAVREATRIGVDVGVFNCPGWSQSGGPWVKEADSMRWMDVLETRVSGPGKKTVKLPVPDGFHQEVTVLAFPLPGMEDETLAGSGPKVVAGGGVSALFDGDLATTADWKGGEVTVELAKPLTARTLVVRPAGEMRATVEVEVSDDGRVYRPVAKIEVDRHRLGVNVGPVPLAPVAAGFPAAGGRWFRFRSTGGGKFAEIELLGSVRVERWPEKQLQKMFQDPLPEFDSYWWRAAAEPDNDASVVKPAGVVDLTKMARSDGVLEWEVPAGEWVVQRVVARPTGTKNGPAPPEATGLEVDKMNREALARHFDAFVGELVRRVPAAERKSLKHVVADSYEMGSQNWTDGMFADFRNGFGYDPRPFLPVLAGRVVDSVDRSDRFLWDLRRLVADRIARDYVGGLRDLCAKHGLRMWLENYGHWGFPAEFLQYGGACDELSGEFWATGDLGSIELRCASSAAHTYGKIPVFAEAFTGGPLWVSHPYSLKKRGDWSLCQGINQFVLHVNIHQPDEARRPGVSAWFGTEFNRHNTWFEHLGSWIDYQRRCSVMLQHGLHLADVAYFIGEDVPKMRGPERPVLPPGHDFDHVNAEVILQRMSVKDGRFVLPDGMSYRLLVLPESETMRPEVLRKIAAMVRQGGAVWGEPPKRSPSGQSYPDCDREVTAMAAEMWGKVPAKGGAAFGKGRVFRGVGLQEALQDIGAEPAVSNIDHGKILHTSRVSGQAVIHFLSNQSDAAVTIHPRLFARGCAPELWHPDTGATERPAVYQLGGNYAQVPVTLGPAGSVFVVFREAATPLVKSVRRGDQVLVDAEGPPVATPAAPDGGAFTVAAWLKPAVETPLHGQTAKGIVGMGAPNNELVAAQHGGSIKPGTQDAGCGISAGTNGVVVFEHGAHHYVPVLVHAAKLNDWTHVAVVYQNKRPELWLNGVKVAEGLSSGRTVHPSKQDGQAAFRGECGPVVTESRALSAAEIVELGKRIGKSAGAARPRISLRRAAEGVVEATAFEEGSYTLTDWSGNTRTIEVSGIPRAVPVDGWSVAFPAGSGIRNPWKPEQLVSWTEHPDPLVQAFSGTAVYQSDFLLPAETPKWTKLGPAVLDLGKVEVMATVVLNGRLLGTLWKPPFRIEVGPVLQAGRNRLELRVVNLWRNRLLAEQRGPENFGGQGVFRPVVDGPPPVKPGDAPLPSGLLGPVRLEFGRAMVVPQ